jgi:DNA-binding transcriptional MerR regulator
MAKRPLVELDAAGLPAKAYFKIGEVATLLGVRPSVLRFWQSEFSSIRPEKSRSGQRLYSRADVEHLLRIRHLLYEERFTIDGAKNRLREIGRQEPAPRRPPPPLDLETLKKFKQGLVDLLRMVDD